MSSHKYCTSRRWNFVK